MIVLQNVPNTGGKNTDSVKTLKDGNMGPENYKDIANAFKTIFTTIVSKLAKRFQGNNQFESE